MKKKYLEKLKFKIAQLTDEELNLRDKYLQDIANGKILGPMTNFQSIDKQWLKYYDLRKISSCENKTVYQSLYEHNKENLKNLAIEYFESKISFAQLLLNIDKTAKSFEQNNVKKGDFVTICAPGIPETVYSFYALSKLGAVANMIAPYFDKNDFVERIADCKSKLLIVMDEFYVEIKDAVERSQIEKVIVVPTLNSSPLKFMKKNIVLIKTKMKFIGMILYMKEKIGLKVLQLVMNQTYH